MRRKGESEKKRAYISSRQRLPRIYKVLHVCLKSIKHGGQGGGDWIVSQHCPDFKTESIDLDIWIDYLILFACTAVVIFHVILSGEI